MTTETPPAQVAPSNVNVRQLAATLTKTAAATRQTREPGAAAPTAPNAEPATHEPPETAAEPGSLTTVDETGTEAATTAETTETGHEGDGPKPGLPAEEVTGEPPVALPPEVAEAIEIAKAMDGGKGKAEMLKRIHKLTDARDTERNGRLTAEEQLKQLRTENQELKSRPGGDARTTTTHPAVHAVQEELNNVDHWLGWCEENLPRLQTGEMETVELPDGKGGSLQVGAKDVAKTRRDLENMRQEIVARKVSTERDVKAQFHQAYQQSHQAALTSYPWLGKTDSAEYTQFQTILKNVPGFKAIPDHELAIGDFLAGKALREGKAKAPAPATRKAPPSREPTRVSTEAPGSGGERTPEEEKTAKETRQQFEKSGSVRDLARTLTASRRVGRTTGRQR